MEGFGFLVEPVLVRTRNPRQPSLHREVQQNGEVRLQASRRLALQLPQGVEVEATAITLVGEGGIGIAIAQHQLPTFQPRAEDLLDMLRTSRGKQEGFRPRCNRRSLAAQQDRPDHLADARAARLPCRPHRVPVIGERGRKTMDLGRLAAAFRPLEGDEEAARFVSGFHRLA